MVGVEDFTAFGFSFGNVRITSTKLDRVSGTNGGTGRAVAFFATMGAEVTFYRMVLFRVVPDRAIGAGNCAFAAAGATVLVNLDNACDRVLANGLWVYRTGAQTCGTLTLLARDR